MSQTAALVRRLVIVGVADQRHSKSTAPGPPGGVATASPARDPGARDVAHYVVGRAPLRRSIVR